MKKKNLIAALLLLCLLLALPACGRRNAPGKADTIIEPVSTPTLTPASLATPTPTPGTAAVTPTPAATQGADQSNQAVILTPEPVASAAPTPTPTPTPAPTPTPTPAPTPTPTPTPSNLPVVTKNPTDETVIVGGSCYFVAKYENAIWAIWHFVSPDGTQDLGFELAQKEFPTMKIINGGTNVLQLQNIPKALDGWKVYCEFSNNNGAVKTERALIGVTESTDGAPKVTKSPTSETVAAGGSAYFVANHEGAVWAVWHFVNPDGTQDLTYSDAAALFDGLTILNGDRPTMQLQNIPASLSGWKVYCAFRNNIGTVNTNAAVITVTG